MQRYQHIRRRPLNRIGARTLLVAVGLSLSQLSSGQAVTLTVAPEAVVVLADGVCALREAFLNANNAAATSPDCPAGSGADTIELTASSTYTLTDAPTEFTADGPNGLPSITTTMTLHGSGATIERSTVDGTPPFRLLHVAATGDLTVQHLTLRGGSTTAALNLLFPSNTGGGLLSHGALTLTQSTISGNNAFIGGGLAAVGSTLTCLASTLSDNNASEGGGLAALNSTVTIINSTISGNSACGGGGLTALDSTVTVISSTISGNLALIGSDILNDGTVMALSTPERSRRGALCDAQTGCKELPQRTVLRRPYALFSPLTTDH